LRSLRTARAKLTINTQLRFYSAGVGVHAAVASSTGNRHRSNVNYNDVDDADHDPFVSLHNSNPEHAADIGLFAPQPPTQTPHSIVAIDAPRR
jgi:hypothetical protein